MGKGIKKASDVPVEIRGAGDSRPVRVHNPCDYGNTNSNGATPGKPMRDRPILSPSNASRAR